ncbi:MAG: hypothetical protein KAJ47_04150, partial [Candidatus Aenigmarchaeota archaeon]|nr:hypothetical protein [Candidatus Aenigmarchaeota archaeon]
DPNCGIGSNTKYASLTVMEDPYASMTIDLNKGAYNITETVNATVNITNIGNCILNTSSLNTYIYDAYSTAWITTLECLNIPEEISYLGTESVDCHVQLNSGITAGNKTLYSVYRWNNTPISSVSAAETFVVLESEYNLEETVTEKKDIVTIGEPVLVVDRFGRTTIQYIYVGSSQ